MKKLLRLRLMGRDELGWRARVVARTQAQRVSSRLRPPQWDRRLLRGALAASVSDAAIDRAMHAEDWQAAHQALGSRLQKRPSRFVLDHLSSDALVSAINIRWPDAAASAAARADRIVAGRYDLLGYDGLSFAYAGNEVDWHYDPVHSRRPPMTFWADVPYLDPAIGDHKIIWELNRHQHWLQLGRALWLTGDSHYGRAIVDRLESWLAANPPLVGIHWASMLEIGFRAISWTWALQFLLADRLQGPGFTGQISSDLEAGRRTPTPESPWLVDMLLALDRQLTHVEHNLSHYFSPNTHLTGEALALYVVGLALPELAASDRWVRRGRDILLAEIGRQIHADGGHAEGSTHYHRYTLDIYLLALLAATRAQDTETIPRFTEAVTRLAEFARTVADNGGLLPLIGDDDGGMLWSMTGRACHDVRDSLALAAVVLGRSDLAPWEVPEEAFWVGGRTAVERSAAIEGDHRSGPGVPSRTFPDSGYVVARDDSGHAVFDVGAHGYLNGGHAHADALAITLSLANRPLLVDPGTSTYTMDSTLRDRMRSTVSHNTIVVDRRSQSIPSGPFHWRTRANARLHAARHNPAFDWAEASHDGYVSLRHRRTLLRTSGAGWLVVDEILGEALHSARQYWHFDPHWSVTADSAGRLHATHVDGGSAWLLHDTGKVYLARGDERAGLGWFAPVYGTLIPAWTAEIEHQAIAPYALVTWIGAGADDGAPSLERLAVACDSDYGAIAARVTAGDRTSIFLTRPGRTASVKASSVTVLDCKTDGRVLHYETVAETSIVLDLIDASYARARGEDWLNLEADTPFAELHVGVIDDVLDLKAFDPPARLRLSGDAVAALRALRLNDREVGLIPAGADGTLTIEGHHWTREHRGVWLAHASSA
jgi:Heparinase II/III-like protein/Heparinase II/III N-terminus